MQPLRVDSRRSLNLQRDLGVLQKRGHSNVLSNVRAFSGCRVTVGKSSIAVGDGCTDDARLIMSAVDEEIIKLSECCKRATANIR